MLRLLVVIILVLVGLSAASADVSCPGTIIMQPGTVVQYKNSSGAQRPGVLISTNNGIKWGLAYFTISGTTALASGVARDQTQTINNTFAVISCQVPF
jgi:hypothetical protein